MTIVDLSKQMPRWAELVLAKVERLAQSAAVANRRADVITLERIEALVRGNTLATPAGSASGEDGLGARIDRLIRLAQANEKIEALQAEVAQLRDRMLELERQRDDYLNREWAATKAKQAAEAEAARLRKDAARLDYIERTFSGMTNRERYLPVQMIWGKGCNGRTLREACDKYMKRDAAMGSANGQG